MGTTVGTLARNQLGTPGRAQIFWTMFNSFKLCPVHFPWGGEKICGFGPVATSQEVRINVYFILISESRPYVLSYRSIYSWVNTVGNFSNVLIEILFTNSWRQSVFAMLLLSLKSWTIFCYFLPDKSSHAAITAPVKRGHVLPYHFYFIDKLNDILLPSAW